MRIKLQLHQDFPKSSLKIIKSSLERHSYKIEELPSVYERKLNTLDISPEHKYSTEELVNLLHDIDQALRKLDNTYKVFFRSMDSRFTLSHEAYDVELCTGVRHYYSELQKVIDEYLSFCQEKTMIICPFINSTVL